MSNGNEKQQKLLEKVEKIDYDAVIARLVGEPLTEQQQESCAMFDEVYDATHPNNQED